MRMRGSEQATIFDVSSGSAGVGIHCCRAAGRCRGLHWRVCSQGRHLGELPCQRRTGEHVAQIVACCDLFLIAYFLLLSACRPSACPVPLQSSLPKHLTLPSCHAALQSSSRPCAPGAGILQRGAARGHHCGRAAGRPGGGAPDQARQPGHASSLLPF